MTLPASGTISMSQFSTEMGQAATYSATIAWINANAKVASNSLSGHYGKAWYNKYVGTNCNTGNCPVYLTSNCGIYQCQNCLLANSQCSTNDGRSWLQANCNCGGPYNCNVSASFTYDCACINCDCNCNC
ncbi:hypothetical protein UFOVP235_15 [uncultured Caudovirales phage]|uniref:Uncharacterized protein n=1 Tax=uncultured Caudovirales phage TaxID=2100421 RepID=A0A6J7WYZ4_9CAUD|nr:hypothetical protein UFOVP235_15 [uncultured Caudovirales phage]